MQATFCRGLVVLAHFSEKLLTLSGSGTVPSLHYHHAVGTQMDVLLTSKFPLWQLCAGLERNYGDLVLTFDDLTSKGHWKT